MDTDLLEKTLQDRVVGGNPNLVSHKIKHIILNNPFRRYFVNKVKAPLLKAIISLANKYPEPTKDNTDSLIAHTLIDIFGEFHKHNRVRRDLFHAVGKVIPSEVEHDSVYAHLFQIFLEYVIEAILDGKWTPRPLNKPSTRYWIKEETPYGGEYSIIHKLLEHRQEILRLIND